MTRPPSCFTSGANRMNWIVSPNPCSVWRRTVCPGNGAPFQRGCANSAGGQSPEFPAPFVFLPPSLKVSHCQPHHRPRRASEAGFGRQPLHLVIPAECARKIELGGAEVTVATHYTQMVGAKVEGPPQTRFAFGEAAGEHQDTGEIGIGSGAIGPELQRLATCFSASSSLCNRARARPRFVCASGIPG